MKNLSQTIYFFMLTITATSNLFCADHQEPLLQRATGGLQVRLARSEELLNRYDATLHTFVIRPHRSLQQIHHEITELKNLKERLISDQHRLNNDITNTKTILYNLENEAYKRRYRPDRYDFELAEYKKPWYDVTARAIKSFVQDDLMLSNPDIRLPKIVYEIRELVRLVFLAGCMSPLIYHIRDSSINRSHQEAVQQNIILSKALQKRIDNCSTNLDFAIEECVYTKYHNVEGFTDPIKEYVFENYKKESATKISSPTSPNPYLMYPIVPYQKPQYYVWQEGNYLECKAKSE